MIRRIFNKLFGNKASSNDWTGNYASWQEAQKQCTGYDDNLILYKVAESIQKVKIGEAAYERDSVAFSEYSYSEDIRSVIATAVPVNSGSIVDFGGSLGSLYFQYKRFIEENNFTWTVVEQSHFVKYGKEHLQDDELKFVLNLSEACSIQKPNLLIAASVLCYLEKPYEWIDKFVLTGADYILIDRTGFIEGNEERITIQTVPEEIYKASYPAWFLNERKFVEALKGKYEVIREFMSEITDSVFLEDNKKVYWKGFVLKRNTND